MGISDPTQSRLQFLLSGLLLPLSRFVFDAMLMHCCCNAAADCNNFIEDAMWRDTAAPSFRTVPFRELRLLAVNGIVHIEVCDLRSPFVCLVICCFFADSLLVLGGSVAAQHVFGLPVL